MALPSPQSGQHKASSAQQELLDFGSHRCSSGQGDKERQTLSSCSGSTVSLNVRLDPSETQSARVQPGQPESGCELPRWGAKRRATSRCAPQVTSPARVQRERQPAGTASRGAVGPVEKPDWVPATPLRQQGAAGGAEQPGPASACLQPAISIEGPPGCQEARSFDRQETQESASQASQQALPTFSADPTVRRAAFKAWRCSEGETCPAGALPHQHSAMPTAVAVTQPLLTNFQAWSAQDAFLRPAASSALQLAPPSLPQVFAGPHHHMTALKPFWSQPQQQSPPHQWPAALPTSGAQPTAAAAMPYPGSHAREQGRLPLPSHPSGPQHVQPIPSLPTAASPWGRSAAPHHPAQLAGLTQASAHASGWLNTQMVPLSASKR